MTTLILSTDPANGYVRLTITPTADITRVTRTDANGTRDVRTMTGQLPHTDDTVLTLDDYEASHGSARYTVATTAGTVRGTIVLALKDPWLGTPENPQYSTAVPSVLDYSASGETRSIVHEPEHELGEPIVIVRGSTTRRGSLRVGAGTYAAALKILRIFQRGQTMLLRQPGHHAGMDMYFIATSYEIVTAAAWQEHSVFDVTCSYIEVGRPGGALTGALGWTWAELEAAFPTWAAVEAAYATWGDVRTDRRTTT
jgi:hypothetical protein